MKKLRGLRDYLMRNFFKTVWFWLENSRIFTVPMSVFSWLVVFVLGLTSHGNVFYGFLTLIGICCGQLATNLFDDYVDYKKLVKLGTLEHQTKSKCAYITNGEATLNDGYKICKFFNFIIIKINWNTVRIIIIAQNRQNPSNFLF